MGVTIQLAPLIEQVSGVEKIPISDNSGLPKAVTTEQLKTYMDVPNETTVEDWGFTKNQGTISAVDLGTNVDEPDLVYVTNEELDLKLKFRKFEVGSVNYGTGREEDNPSRLRTYYIPTKDISYIYGRSFNLVFFDSSFNHVGYLANISIAEEKDFSNYDYVRIVNAYSSNEDDIIVWYKDEESLLDYELGNKGVRLLKNCMLINLNTMKFQSQDGFYSAIIPCKKGDTINITGKGGKSAILYTITDGNNIIERANPNDLVYKKNIHILADGYAIVNFSGVFPYNILLKRQGVVNITSNIVSIVEDLNNSANVVSGVFNSWEQFSLDYDGNTVSNTSHHIRVDLSKFNSDYVIQGKLRCIAQVYSLVYDKDGNILRRIQGNENDFYYRIQDDDAYIILSNFSASFPLENVYLKIERKTDKFINSLSNWEQSALGIDGLNINNNGHHIRIDLSDFNTNYVIQGKLRCIAQVYSLVYDKNDNLLRTVQGQNNDFYYKIQDGDAYIVLSNFSPNFPLENVSISIYRPVIGGSRKLRVLCIGNSYTYDAMSYTPYIMRMLNSDVNIEIGIWYHGGQSLEEHWENIQNKTAVDYQYAYSNGVEPWSVRKEVTFDEVLLEGWDVITLQQVSYLSRDYTSYQPYLDNIINYIQENTLNHVKFMWLLTPSYSKNYAVNNGGYLDDYTSDKMHEEIVAASKSAYENTIIEGIIPVGTAIQNARHTELASLGDNYGELNNSIHLQSGLPCKIESMTSALCLFRLIGMEYVSVAGFKFYVTSDWLDLIQAPQEDGVVTGETLENNIIALRCVIYAVNNKKFF